MMTILEQYDNRPRNWWKTIIVGLLIVMVVTWSGSVISFNGITAKGSEIAMGVIHGLTHPDLSLVNFTNEGVPYALFQTIAIAVLGTVLGALIAVPFAFLSSENIVPKPIAFIFRSFTMAIRTIPALVWALIWIRVTGPGAFCGVVTQMVCSIGMIAKMYITAIEDLDTKILESLDAAGCNTFEKIWCGILPQLYANFISAVIYRFDINIKDASILGMVGAGGIGAPLIQCINSRRWSMVGSYLLGLIICVFIIEYVSTRIRKKLVQGE